MTAGALWAGFSKTEAAPLLGKAQQSTDAEIQLPPIDAARIASRVVSSLQPARGERAILVYDPTYYLDLTRAMEMELTRAGVHPIIGLTFDPPEVVRALGADPARKREEEVVSALRPIFEKADLFFWLPTRALSPDLRWERLLDVSPARGIHFHWITPPTGRSADEIRMLARIYERAILETDYAALSKEQDRLIAALRGQTIRITAPDGTDLRMRVPRDAWFHKNDGNLSPARARLAKSVRDREMEFPCGALRFIPDGASVDGKLVVRRVPTPGGLAEGVTIGFERGRAVGQRAEKNEAAFRAQWQTIGGDIGKVGEIVIGTNPLLVATLPSGDLPYYGYGAGYVRVSLGDNWESGGANRSPGGRPLWLFLEQASLDADGKAVIQRGQLVK
jgi:leucyl aminopeptidase (aminopeptidase T)